jgi:hypothetical protein
MTDEDDQYSPEETARRRDEAIRRALDTPPKPQKEIIGKSWKAVAQTAATITIGRKEVGSGGAAQTHALACSASRGCRYVSLLLAAPLIALAARCASFYAEGDSLVVAEIEFAEIPL